MDLTLVVTFVVLLVAAAAAWIYMTRRRSERLRGRFGPEYDRALHEAGDQRRAESLLEKREQRVQKFQIRHLTDEEKHRFAEAWLGEQARFVDDPPGAVLNADTLVNHVMRTRGYPMAEFEQRAEDLSVEYPKVVENYRVAHAIAEHLRGGEVSTENLREAMVRYRALFEQLLETRLVATEPVHR